MDDETKKLIGDQLKTLPKTIQDAILNSGWEQKTHTLAKKYQLHIDQEGTLVNETFMIMLGLELAKDFNQNLVNNLGISKIIASQIEGDINEQIFKPIKKELQTLNDSIIAAENTGTKQTELAKEVLGTSAPLSTPPRETALKEEELDRDAILREIEEPLTHPIASIIKPAPITPPTTPSPVQTTTVSTVVEPMPTVSVMPTSPNMIDEKLKNVVKTEKREVVIENIPTGASASPKRTDPYREPIA